MNGGGNSIGKDDAGGSRIEQGEPGFAGVRHRKFEAAEAGTGLPVGGEKGQGRDDEEEGTGQLPRPRVVSWTVRAGDKRSMQRTRFLRDQGRQKRSLQTCHCGAPAQAGYGPASVTMNKLFTGMSLAMVCFLPEGQASSMRSTLLASPSPK